MYIFSTPMIQYSCQFLSLYYVEIFLFISLNKSVSSVTSHQSKSGFIFISVPIEHCVFTITRVCGFSAGLSIFRQLKLYKLTCIKNCNNFALFLDSSVSLLSFVLIISSRLTFVSRDLTWFIVLNATFSNIIIFQLYHAVLEMDGRPVAKCD